MRPPLLYHIFLWLSLFPFHGDCHSMKYFCIFLMTFSFLSFVFYYILANFKLWKGRDHLRFLNPGDLVYSSVPDTCYYCYQCLILISCVLCARHCSKVIYINHLFSIFTATLGPGTIIIPKYRWGNWDMEKLSCPTFHSENVAELRFIPSQDGSKVSTYH